MQKNKLNYYEIHQFIYNLLSEIKKDILKKKKYLFLKSNQDVQSKVLTNIDLKIDSFLQKTLQEKYPDIGFITEESNCKIKKYNWIIDPIDGTSNFAKGLPFFGISIALWHKSNPLYGNIYIPAFEDRIWAVAGQDAWHNGKKVKLMPYNNVQPYVLWAPVGGATRIAQMIKKITENIAYPRDFGSCVYQITKLVSGQADLMVAYNLSVWDIAAAVLICSESNLAVKYIGLKPEISKSFNKQIKYTVLFGETNLVNKLYKILV